MKAKIKAGNRFDSLRDFVNRVDELGDCKKIDGADWDLEIGVIGELQSAIPNSPLLLFDRIKGYPAGFRVATNIYASNRRTALAYGLAPDVQRIELVRALRDKFRAGPKLIPSVEVKSAPVKENVHLGDDVDLFIFPTPKWHEFDGGRYIGTGSMTITRDPDEGWVNMGTYRVQIHDKNTATVMISPGHHGGIMRQKYWDKGQSCPAVVTCGQEPMLFAASHFEVPWGISEYDYAGWLRGQAVGVTRGVFTDLPIPATAEIALEGEMLPPEAETRVEGPFGEWAGYYASGGRPMPVFKVRAILHRNNPILQGNPPSRFPPVWSVGRHIQVCATLWNELDNQIPGIKGVWCIDDAAFRGMTVISLHQTYAGHAKQAALLALGSSANMRLSRYIIIVDEDIDPSNTSEVLWALGTRTDPKYTTEFIDGCWGGPGNPMVPRDKLARGELEYSRAIILACKPYHWMKDFPKAVTSSPELQEKIKRKWAELFPEV